MGTIQSLSLGFLGLLLLACGAGAKQNEAEAPAEPPPSTEENLEEPASEPPADKESDEKEAEEKDENDDDDSDETAKKPAAPEPQFTDEMSVEEAIAAVPQGTSRLNMENDALSKPLTDPALYAPCKPAGSQHFKVRVAVWNGKAVGVDVTAKPANPRLAACISKQVRSANWDDKVPSLNTVEYSY